MTDEIPSVLFHYTDTSGLMGILGSRSLRATDAQFLNDTTELQLTARMMSEAMDVMATDVEQAIASGDEKFPLRPALAEGLHAAAEKMRLAGNLNEQEGEMSAADPRAYVTCFTADGDRLGQWRGYGQNGGGFAMGFNSAALSRLRYRFDDLETDPLLVLSAAQSPIGLLLDQWREVAMEYDTRANPPVKVRYGTSELEDLLSSTLAEFSIVRNPYFKSVKMVSMIAYNLASRLLGQAKDLNFSEEREWRVVVAEAFRRPKVDFFVRQSIGMVPFVRLALPAEAVEVIRIGPSGQPSLRERSLRQYLASNGYSKVRIEKSNVPFRT